jgi:hypothetical protein
MTGMIRVARLLPLLLLAGALGCCSTYTELIEEGLQAYKAGRMVEAQQAFATAEEETSEVHLVQLEKGTAFLAGDNPPAAIDNYTRALNTMNRYIESDAVATAASYVLDDTVTDYPGAPYEQICARLFLGLAYLMTPEPFEDVSAAFRDMDIKMEQIEAYYERTYEVDGEGNPAQFSFQIPPAAKYFAALAAEQRRELDSAEIYLRQAIQGMPGCKFFQREAARMQRGRQKNIVFVVGFLGMVPHKIETESEELTAVLKGAKVLYAIAKPDNNPNALARAVFTAPVMIPGYPPRTPFWHGGFQVRTAASGREVETSMIADFDHYAREEFDKLLPGIMIRAAVRRAIKETAGQLAGSAVTEDRETARLLGDLFASIAAVAETVDTRGWCTLPREIHAANFLMPADENTLTLTPLAPNGAEMGPGITVRIDSSNPRPAFVFVWQPGPNMRPIVIVDVGHRPAPATE